ncbi:Imidazole glycerol phosphate synthase subunit HisH [uncultured Paludibacter sp.]|uniref:Imidazole glycerol phosphate synthase subunit HisH n=1 Tax=uncultured Paludibacter sp. TaxID=497635 RepID=A0A653AFQ5_9BACT|nr:Imidazole glycerol phosphate synthase subunit HisH [uncultured Paludibacter sp.]
MKISIIKYNAGNIQSVLFALQRIGIEAIVTDDKDKILSSDKVIFPGVGEASSAMKYLKEKNLDTLIKNLKQPVLGICLGMQLMCRHSEENNTDCLGIFDLNVKRFPESELKVPQIGWNNIFSLKSPLLKGISEKEYMYFVHSYYVEKCTESIALTDYGLEYSSAIQKDNFYAVQFHPEKSGEAGQKILENFINL